MDAIVFIILQTNIRVIRMAFGNLANLLKTIRTMLSYSFYETIKLGPVVQKAYNAIHWINRCPVNKYRQNKLHYPLDSDRSISPR